VSEEYIYYIFMGAVVSEKFTNADTSLVKDRTNTGTERGAYP